MNITDYLAAIEAREKQCSHWNGMSWATVGRAMTPPDIEFVKHSRTDTSALIALARKYLEALENVRDSQAWKRFGIIEDALAFDPREEVKK